MLEWYIGLGVLMGLIPLGISLRDSTGVWTNDKTQILASTMGYLLFICVWPYFVLCWILIWLKKEK